MRHISFFILVLMFHSALCMASTWQVELDGSGDFIVIQDAVDAAAPGDTILIGPGRFETVRPVPYWEGYSSTITIMKGGLVIEGAGPDQTVIGTGIIDWNYRAIIGWSDSAVFSFTLNNATITGGYNGLHYEGDDLLVDRCNFSGSEFGIAAFSVAGCVISNCNFSGLEFAFSNYSTNSDLQISDCYFDDCHLGISVQFTSQATVNNCVINHPGSGIQFDGVVGSVNNCQVFGASDSGYGSGMVFTGGSRAEINDCTIDWSMTDNHSALRIVNGSILSGTMNLIKGGGLTSIYCSGPGCLQDFHHNEITKANTFSLIAKFFDENFNNPNIIMDISNNYWGTENESLISTWIDDAIDHPNDPTYRQEVFFHPPLSELVPVKKKTLGNFKSMFRE